MPVGIRSGQSDQPMILDGAEDVVLETTRASEELILGFRHRQSRPHFHQFDEAQRGDEIGHLQKSEIKENRDVGFSLSNTPDSSMYGLSVLFPIQSPCITKATGANPSLKAKDIPRFTEIHTLR